jgi:hypothetical protein
MSMQARYLLEVIMSLPVYSLMSLFTILMILAWHSTSCLKAAGIDLDLALALPWMWQL